LAASIARRWKGAEVKLTAQGDSKRNGGMIDPSPLAPYALLGLEATKNLGSKAMLWLLGENLTGSRYELRPGYPEPRFKARAGLEIVL
jgi:hypothetical protein